MDSHRKSMDEALAQQHEPPAPIPVIPPGTVAYEKTDVNATSILRIGVVLTVVTVAAAAAAFGYFRLLVAHEERNDPPPPPLARPAEGRLPPEPRLQTAPPAELRAMQDADRLALSGYGWVDQAGGVARIPIEEAMALYVDQAGRAASQPAAPAPSPIASSVASPMASPMAPPPGEHR